MVLYIAIPRRVLSRSAAMRRSGQVQSSELWLAKENEGFLRGYRAENGIPRPRISCFQWYSTSSLSALQFTPVDLVDRTSLGSCSDRSQWQIWTFLLRMRTEEARRLLGPIDKIPYSGVKPGVISVIFIYCALISAESHTVIGTVSCSLSCQGFDDEVLQWCPNFIRQTPVISYPTTQLCITASWVGNQPACASRV